MSAALCLAPPLPGAGSARPAAKPPTIIVLRAREVNGILPRSGQMVRSAGGGAVFLVLAVARVRTAGEPDSERVRFTLRKLRKDERPADEPILPWPAATAPAARVQRPAPAPAIVPPAASAKPAGGEKSASHSGAERRRLKRRAKQRRDRRGGPSGDAVPAITQSAVRDERGLVIRPPLVSAASWRDPDDRNTASAHAKLVRGWVTTDSIAWLAKRNRKITDDHVAAADCYRLAWERAHRSPGAASLIRTDGGGGGGGPTDDAARAVRAWRRVQATLSKDARSLLSAVVLNRGLVGAWAEMWGLEPEYAVGFLIGVLEQLATYYRGEIEKRRRDGVVMED
jgi:hypothetical protein